MPKYVIEREIPGAGDLSPEELQAISQKSCNVLQNLGPQINWVESYVTADKVYCVYIAPSEDMIRAHAQQGGFPANRISEIKTTIDPTTAETQRERGRCISNSSVVSGQWSVGRTTDDCEPTTDHGRLTTD